MDARPKGGHDVKRELHVAGTGEVRSGNVDGLSS